MSPESDCRAVVCFTPFESESGNGLTYATPKDIVMVKGIILVNFNYSSLFHSYLR